MKNRGDRLRSILETSEKTSEIKTDMIEILLGISDKAIALAIERGDKDFVDYVSKCADFLKKRTADIESERKKLQIALRG